jgi:hypothetical protein
MSAHVPTPDELRSDIRLRTAELRALRKLLKLAEAAQELQSARAARAAAPPLRRPQGGAGHGQ